jgi:hypothetical protein
MIRVKMFLICSEGLATCREGNPGPTGERRRRGCRRVSIPCWTSAGICSYALVVTRGFMARPGGERFNPPDGDGVAAAIGAAVNERALKGGHVETSDVETRDACRDRTSRERSARAEVRVGDAGRRPHRGKMRKVRYLKSRLETSRPGSGGIHLQGVWAEAEDDVKEGGADKVARTLSPGTIADWSDRARQRLYSRGFHFR